MASCNADPFCSEEGTRVVEFDPAQWEHDELRMCPPCAKGVERLDGVRRVRVIA
ncbi:hypothetical protein HUG10_21175 (plasmid) [Halorarum halophilum]|uniref:Uncharacterized protein n=1 Tax=Halorarum halophilum TaxID=2743090 RepID=A0A7D5K425_9EURY|nr:hypothetical protein [Halobaculum halophilum]QLG30101.1 hypothetical protein HUG10_21175 [Halobaculum halophilum]